MAASVRPLPPCVLREPEGSCRGAGLGLRVLPVPRELPVPKVPGGSTSTRLTMLAAFVRSLLDCQPCGKGEGGEGGSEGGQGLTTGRGRGGPQACAEQREQRVPGCLPAAQGRSVEAQATATMNRKATSLGLAAHLEAALDDTGWQRRTHITQLPTPKQAS